MIAETFLIIGMILLCYALYSMRIAWRKLKIPKLKKMKIIIVTLIILFLLGYFFELILIMQGSRFVDIQNIITSAIFLCGSIFVVLVIQIHIHILSKLEERGIVLDEQKNKLDKKTKELNKTKKKLTKAKEENIYRKRLISKALETLGKAKKK